MRTKIGNKIQGKVKGEGGKLQGLKGKGAKGRRDERAKGIKGRKGEGKMATGNKLQATGRQATTPPVIANAVKQSRRKTADKLSRTGLLRTSQ
ncbi:MAG: hypothetical protein LBL13_04780 [Bacteroidales bacterium]|nr:hypothetical protein [Bacteroidales bacterium]